MRIGAAVAAAVREGIRQLAVERGELAVTHGWDGTALLRFAD